MAKLRHIFICGAHSTGKTTLVNELEQDQEMQRWGITVRKELARDLMREEGISQEMLKDGTNLLWLNLKILEKSQEKMYETEEAYFLNEEAIVTWDRSVIDPLTYISEYISEEEEQKASLLPHVTKMLTKLRDCKSSLCFVIAPHPKCLKNDGVRYQSGNFQSLQRFNVKMKSLMRHHNINFVEIADLDNRCNFVKETIRKKWMLS